MTLPSLFSFNFILTNILLLRDLTTRGASDVLKIARGLIEKMGSVDQAVVLINSSLSSNNVKPNNIDEGKDMFFYMRTYAILGSKYGEATWAMFYNLLNECFSTLDKTTEEKVLEFYEKSWNDCQDMDKDNFNQMLDNISSYLNELLTTTDIVNNVYEFIVSKDIDFPDLTNAGTRAHDRPEFTFRLEEYKILTSLSMFCKIMSPIWGHIIYNSRAYVKTTDKEAYCLITFLPVLEHDLFREIYYKLENYTMNSITKQLDKQKQYNSSSVAGDDINFTIAYKGYTEEFFLHIVYGTLFVKKLASFQPMEKTKPDGSLNPRDIMKYIASSIRATIPTTMSAIQKTSSTMVRRDPSDANDRSESDSVTLLENQSYVSKKSISIPVLVEFGIDKVIELLLKENKIPKRLYKEVTSFYMKNQITYISPFTKTILAMFASYELGGSASLKYLKYSSMVKLISICQLWLASSDYDQTLLHFMSALSVQEKFGTFSNVDQQIIMSIRQRYRESYTRLIKSYPNHFGGNKSIDIQLEECFAFIANNEHIYNTAPAIMDLLDLEIDNGNPIIYDETIVNSFCNFIYDQGPGRLQESRLA